MKPDLTSPTESLPPGSRLDRPRLKIAVAAGPDYGAELLLEQGTYRVGKGSQADLRLSDGAVSRTHLLVEVLPETVRVVDNQSTNGSYCEGMRFNTVEAKPGAIIRIGRTELKLLPVTDHLPPLPPSQSTRFGALVGQSLKMRELFARLERISQSDSDVFIRGETGSGKDLCARAIHAESPRAKGPFVVCDLAAMQPSLIESELFGHVRGAFTGATGDRAGLFERANGGVLFIDEVGELPLDLQPRLLRVLEQREVKRVGGNEYKPVDVRIISATHRGLEKEVAENRFRRDLFHRLAVMEVVIPPLRDRAEDIPLLVDETLTKMGHPPGALTPETLALLAQHPWPGNVRELRNVVERAVLLGKDAVPEVPLLSRGPAPQGSPSARPFREARDELVSAFERDYLADLMRRCSGRIGRAVDEAQIDRTSLKRLLKKHGLE